jgi:hypothetical protein
MSKSHEHRKATANKRKALNIYCIRAWTRLSKSLPEQERHALGCPSSPPGAETATTPGRGDMM